MTSVADLPRVGLRAAMFLPARAWLFTKRAARATRRDMMLGDDMNDVRTGERFAVGSSADVPEGGRLVVDAVDKTVGVFRIEGRLYAYENTCPHQGGPVCQGLVIPAVNEVLDGQGVSTGFAFDSGDMRIVCPWHGFEFSIRTGCHPAARQIRLLPVAVEEQDGAIYVSF